MIKKICVVFIALLMPVVAAEAQEFLKSTMEDQTKVEVTVYNNNLGLVKDTRKIGLPLAEGELRFMDVASKIMPVTVYVTSLNQPDRFTVLEQNYEYDLIDAEKLLNKYVGKKIKIVDWRQYQDRKDIVEAELLSNNDGQIYRVGDEIYLGYPGYKVLPEIPDNLIAKPTLTWLYSNQSTTPHNIEVSYLTRDISWSADYVLVVDKDDIKADMSSWVSLDNQSGAVYENAKLKLVAGEVHTVDDDLLFQAMPKKAMAYGARDQQFEEQAFFEYHIYDLKRPTTIKNNQTKQINLIEAQGIDIKKEFQVRGMMYNYSGRYTQDKKQPVNVYIKFENSEKNKLGMPLPAGIIRMYKEDDKKSLQFIGEDKISHTPKNEQVRLKVGEAFDIVAEKTQTDYRQLSSNLHETEWDITLRNHKQEDIVVNIIEPVSGNWEIISSSHDYKKIDAFTVGFDIRVPKGGQAELKYRMRVGL
jgi:hypothetical protein